MYLLLQLIALMNKEAFISTMGGASEPVGPNGATTQQVADQLETILTILTTPGPRVYPPEVNRTMFWTKLIETIANNGG